jgi:hypothetical protein
MDRVFFPRFRSVDVRAPLFVIGNFRSGTSLAYNMLASATSAVTSFATWQIYLAPTISQRKLVRFWALVDRVLFRGWWARLVVRLNERYLKTVPVHPIDLFAPEEDAGLLMISWSGFFPWFVFPRRGVDSPFVRFDDLDARYRRRVLRTYRTFVQRHLYDASVCGRRPIPTFVSKNPTFTGMIRSLRETFPGSTFLYMMRNADETYRSTMDWFGYWASRVGDRFAEVEPERVWSMMRHWYRYPPTVFEHLPEREWAIVSLERLIAAPDRMLIQLARRLELAWLDDPDARRRAVRAMHRNYGSRYGVPPFAVSRTLAATSRLFNRSVAALLARESAASVRRRFQTDLRRGFALALREE